MKYPQLVPFALGLCALATSAGLRAQPSPYSPEQAEPEAEELVVLSAFNVSSETIDRYRAAEAVSAVRIRTQLIETPSSISVLTRDFMEDVAPVRIHDAAKYIASIQDGEGTMYGDRIMIRGFESAFSRTVDNFGDIGAHNYDESLIERIEVSKGPNAILSPGGPPGGTINIVTKSPQFIPKHSLTALIGNFDAQKVTLDTTAPFGSDHFAYRLIAAYQDTERYWASSAKLRSKLIAPQFTWRVSPTSELVARYDYLETSVFREPALIIDSSVTRRGQEPILGPGFRPKGLNGTPPWSGLAFQKHSLSLSFSTSFNQYLVMRLAGRVQRFDEYSDQAFLFPPGMAARYNPYTGIATPDEVWGLANPNADYDEVLNPYIATSSPYYDPSAVPIRGERIIKAQVENYAVQNDWALSFETPLARLQTVTGFAYVYGELVDQRVNGALAPINLFDLANQDSSVAWDTVLFRDVKNENTNWQVYLNQRVTFWEDRFALSGGYLRYNTETKSLDKATSNPQDVLDESKDMYLASLLVRVTPAASIYYSYSTNAQPAVVNFTPLWREGKQHEWGAKLEFFNRRLAVNLAYFEINQTNVSTPNIEYYAGDLSQPPSFLSDFGNHGTEVEINGAITRNLSVMGSFTRLRMRDSLGRHVRSVSDQLGAALVNYRFNEGLLKGLSLYTGFSYVGERAGDTPSVDFTPLGVATQNSFFVPSHTTWNAGGAYTWSRYQLRLMVDNLTDDKGYVKGSGGRFSQSGIETATGRNVRLQTTMKF
ncbi:TonB-dependent siderophore receptor [Cephaloticoccus primus]|nr:TonB-dependent receptor plug domain-containing protein [Cephaloticoccus primus]